MAGTQLTGRPPPATTAPTDAATKAGDTRGRREGPASAEATIAAAEMFFNNGERFRNGARGAASTGVEGERVGGVE